MTNKQIIARILLSLQKDMMSLANSGCSTKDIQECITFVEKQDEQRNKINSCKITFEDVLALECSMKTAKITKGGEELYKILVPLYNKIHNAYLAEKQDKNQSLIET